MRWILFLRTILYSCKYYGLTVRAKATCLVHAETPSNVRAVQLNWKKLVMSKRLHEGFLLHSFPFWAHCICVSQTGLSTCQGSLFCGRTFNLFQTFSVKELKCNWKGQEREKKACGLFWSRVMANRDKLLAAVELEGVFLEILSCMYCIVVYVFIIWAKKIKKFIPLAFLLVTSLSHSSKEEKNLFDRASLLSLAFIYRVEILNKYVLWP